MVIYGQKTLLLRCHSCEKLNMHDLNIFDIVKGEEVEYKCECGETNVSIKTSDYGTYWMRLNCFICGNEHIYRYTLKELLNMDNSIVFKESEFDNYFKNVKVITACLNELDRLNKDGNINCDCGTDGIVVEIFSDRIELRCLNCSSVHIIYAETEEDLEVLLEKEKIVMHKNNIACIDSIIEKNKNIKKEQKN